VSTLSATLGSQVLRTPQNRGNSKSAHDAIACRTRCWKYDWAIDLDVQKFFDEVPWDLVMKAVRAVTDCRWVLLYVERWLAAPLKRPHRALGQRSKGTPQGSAVSPILANLFMHYAFDAWMARNLPGCPFERYADDAIVHCTSRRQAEEVLDRIAARMQEVGLRLHPEKTRIVYCKVGRRRATHEHTSFTFLGYAFRARGARTKDGRCFTGFLPAISPEALLAKGAELRAMRIHRRTDLTLDDLARWLNPIVAGVDQLLRPVLPVGDLSPPATPQRLPAALGGPEIQTAANREALPEVVDRAARTTARSVHALARGPHVLGPIRRAR
jgi:RNA-directed DNA polymerase